MTETRDMKLGGRIFAVPRLPFGVNMKVYPLLRRLHNSGISDRLLQDGGAPSEEDMADLGEVAFVCARAAEPELTREAFDALPIEAPMELLDAFQVAKFQSGGWVEVGGAAAAGEGKGEPKPPTSTSDASSES